MRAGRLRHQVVVQSPGGTRSSVGQRVSSYTDVATVYASIERLTGTEAFQVAQRQATSTNAIVLRYSSAIAAINASWRIKYVERLDTGASVTRYFTIDAPPENVDERDRVFRLICTEGPRVE